ncbi:MAG TPA: glycoside hydrolase domain-containing protein [Actinoplanes sp.]|nr:glycoside hydrolase domain-containing protein [Actinoplanes sp.]
MFSRTTASVGTSVFVRTTAPAGESMLTGTTAPIGRSRLARAAVVAALGLAPLAVPAGVEAAPGLPAAAGAAAPAPLPGAPGRYRGLGFDTCTAPSDAAMQAWAASPYRAVGIYFGGANRACPQPNLTAAWVARQRAAGWHLMPIYLGPQASCTSSSKPELIVNSRAAAQGRAAADDAAVQAAAIGLPRDSVLIYDMEAYRTNDAACRAGVLAFMSAWTKRLHDHAYASGFYSSMGSGVADQVANYHTAGYARPDYLDFARWDREVTVSDPAIPADYWMPGRRMKQYRGDHLETWGGVTINIDNNYLDVTPLPTTPFGDVTGNGWPDVLARTASTGNLFIYPGNGTTVDEGARRRAGEGWSAMNAMVRIGDLDDDGREDLVARHRTTGDLWFYPGTRTGFGTLKRIGTGWNAMREITAAGDLNRDGHPDLLAVRTSDGTLFCYPGRAGAALGPRIRIGTGWNTMSELAGVGDLNADGYPDLIARRSSDGVLFLYRGTAGGFAARLQTGTGWNAMRDLVGVGDFTRDGVPDLAAVRRSTGNLMLYRGRATGVGAAIRIGTGFAGRKPLL